MEPLVPVEIIEKKILLIRGQKVMLDSDLAELYGVETRTLIQAVKRNIDRFPPDFLFQLGQEEFDSLRSQIVISKGKGGRRYFPYAFTEQGVSMLSSVLRSARAIKVNITIMRVFVRLRQMMATHRALAGKLAELEERIQDHDEQITDIFKAIRQLMVPVPPEARKRKIGFDLKEKQARYGKSGKNRKK
jgi:phage regulator Rha-like protein